ncbi:zinc-ribbon domain-containing protein [Paracidovorax citrulli]|uniref:zinc-ribbon domain-containing protein n=1 Tax=Paracidovorax citrulli TaxID=80869 RepID=UPI0009E198F7
MNLIKCPDCNKEVSKNAQKCPHCGAKLKMVGFSKTILVVLGVCVVIVLMASVSVLTDSPTVREANQNKAICEMNIGKMPTFTQEICDYNYQQDLNK